MSERRAAGPVELRVPEGDDRERLVCADCGFIRYENPKIVVGSVAYWQDKILMCRRAIEPRLGRWTLPAGYMEMQETTEQGALREAWEEARAKIEIETLLAIYQIPHLGQVQFMYRARLLSPEVVAGPESAEVALFDWPTLPWGEIAFPTVRWALEHFRQTRAETAFAPRGNPPEAAAL